MLEKERFMVVFGHKMHFREIERFPGKARYMRNDRPPNEPSGNRCPNILTTGRAVT